MLSSEDNRSGTTVERHDRMVNFLDSLPKYLMVRWLHFGFAMDVMETV